MDEQSEYRKACAIELYDAQVILQTVEGEGGFYECDSPRWGIDGPILENMAYTFNLPFALPPSDYKEGRRCNINDLNLDLRQKPIYYLERFGPQRRVVLYAHPRDDNLLDIRMVVQHDDDSNEWVMEFLYNGAYSIEWAIAEK